MFESVKRAIDEIFGSVIQPLKEWILRRSWGVRVICLIVIALAAFSYWKPQTVVGASQTASFYWRSWRSAGAIPIDASARRSLSIAIERLSQSVDADLPSDLGNSNLTPWAASQSVMAMSAVDRPLADRAMFVQFVRAGQLRDCFCWTEREGDARADALSSISGWVAAAFARQGVPLSDEDLDYVLAAQNSAGWWPMFPESGAARYGSTYSTAWLALGLHMQRSAGLVPSDRRRDVNRAIARATSWLLLSRGDGARWRSHLNGAPGNVSESVSGFTLSVLHEVGGRELADLDTAWLDSLPNDDLEPHSTEDYNIELPYERRTAIDHISQVRLPWILLATVKAYPNGSVGEKARALRWLNKVLKNPKVRAADTDALPWVRAELLLGLVQASKGIECANCKKGT